jgi:hypothetical protein
MKKQKKYQLKMQVKKIAKIVIFHLLLTLRGVVLLLSKILALLFLASGILLCIITEAQAIPWLLKIIILSLGILFTLINWFYDDLIFYFQPENREIQLYR